MVNKLHFHLQPKGEWLCGITETQGSLRTLQLPEELVLALSCDS